MTSKRNVFVGTVFIAIGILLLSGCCTLMLYNAKEDLDAEHAVMNQLPVLHQVVEAKLEAAGTVSVAAGDSTEAEDVIVPAHVHNSAMTVVDIDKYGYIGYLSLPSIELELPVMDKCDKTRLKRAPCLYYGSLYTNDLVIAGHNYQSSFGQLKKLSIGDKITFTDMDGVVHTYVVDDIEVLEPTDVTEMVASGWNLSLYTCTYDGSQRLTVRCTEEY